MALFSSSRSDYFRLPGNCSRLSINCCESTPAKDRRLAAVSAPFWAVKLDAEPYPDSAAPSSQTEAIISAIHKMDVGDRLCLIAFSSTATCLLPFTCMDAAGKAKAQRPLPALRTTGATNYGPPLQMALEMIEVSAGVGVG